ncbi:MAG: hypothetical protein JSW34_06735 [Candidatus Zixiibacteriota bacterium]|nr:MAG: hypothetical protein JSW34_06735 [candidate division Zixibacteria bacterium]
MKNTLWWPLIIAVSALATGTLTFLQAVTPLRAAVGFWFLLVCPGMAYVRLLRVKSVFFEWVLAITLSIAIDTIVAQALLVTGNWSSRVALIVVIVVSLPGIPIQIIFANPGQTKES